MSLSSTEKLMQGIAEALDAGLNGEAKGDERQIAFVVLLANFGEIEGGRVNYVSNANRADIMAILRELLSRFGDGESPRRMQ